MKIERLLETEDTTKIACFEWSKWAYTASQLKFELITRVDLWSMVKYCL